MKLLGAFVWSLFLTFVYVFRDKGVFISIKNKPSLFRYRFMHRRRTLKANVVITCLLGLLLILLMSCYSLKPLLVCTNLLFTQ